MPKTFATIVFLYCLVSGMVATAQLQVQPTIGAGFCYPHTRDVIPNLKSVIKPNGGIMIHIPVTQNFQLQSGAILLQTGYNSERRETSVRAGTVYSVQNTINYLSIPLLASYNVYNKNDFQYWIDAGINYNFFLSGRSHYVVTDYLNDVSTASTTFDRNINGPLIRQDIDPNAGRNDLTGLDLSFRIQFHMIWNKHYTAGVYWDNGLYSILANPADASYISLHSIGISIGYIIL
ncbi:MAG: outer membrane beta-barrel protein [Flavipsychrobacter sp.]